MFIEYSAISNFTFLKGASHPEEYMNRAALLGLPAIAIADENSVAGIVRAHKQARKIKRLVLERKNAETNGPPIPCEIKPPPSANITNIPRLIPAAQLIFEEGIRLTALPQNLCGWANLCRLISKAKTQNTKKGCKLTINNFLKRHQDMKILIHPPHPFPWTTCIRDWLQNIERLKQELALQMHFLIVPVYDGEDQNRFEYLIKIANTLNLPVIASSFPIMHHGKRRRLADVLSAIRMGCRVEELGSSALVNSENRLRSEEEMLRIFKNYPHAVEATQILAEELNFSLDELRYEYPSEVKDGEKPNQRLKRLAHTGLKWRYPDGAPQKIRKTLEHELNLIEKLEYEPYFLTVNDIVDFARSRDILCQGRGSAANSVVCYCLGITSVSPEIGSMVFERFISEARNEPPDIDVDFEHERREEVIQHIYGFYGRHKAALCAAVVHYRGKRAVREVGAAMGLSQDTLSALSSQIWGWSRKLDTYSLRLNEIGLDPTDSHLRLTIKLIQEIIGFPRHLSQHVGGFVITKERLDEIIPIENATMEGRTVICWDKDDINELGILKVDVLSLGMLTCLRKAFGLLRQYLGKEYNLSNLPPEDPKVYDMLCKADSIGVFQVESRAQMNFLPRMQPRCFYDLVIEVAIVRPGPIQGDMVHPYIRRRNKEEKIDFPSGKLGKVLEKTLGVPLFQEQAMQIAIVGAGFTPDEADRLRRSLATFRNHGNVCEFKGRFLNGMQRNGYTKEFAERCFSQIEGFGSYGFPESHAASFALLVYASAWIKCHHPSIFACALLNSQPMGFYAPAQIVIDAKKHGVKVLPISINDSYWDCTIEHYGREKFALRLGFRQIKGLHEDDIVWISTARGNGYQCVKDVWHRTGIPLGMLKKLAEADTFATLGIQRREALWEAEALIEEYPPLPIFPIDTNKDYILEPKVQLQSMSLKEEMVEDYATMRLSLRAHPVALLRHILTPKI